MSQPAADPTPVLRSLEDASRMLGGVSRWTLRRWEIDGILTIVRIGRRSFIADTEIHRLANEHRHVAPRRKKTKRTTSRAKK